MKANTILVPLESYLYLQEKQHTERSASYKQFDDDRVKRAFYKHSYNGFYQLYDNDLGGCIGEPFRAFEEGRWTSWSCEDMKQILDNAGLPYKDGEQEEIINL